MAEGEATEKTTIEIIESIKETDEFKTLIKNSNETYFEANIGDKIGPKVKEAYSNIDSVFSNVLGVKKQDGQKTSELAKIIAQELKDFKSNNKDKRSDEEIIAEHKKLSKAQIDKLKEENANLVTENSNLQLQGTQQVSKSEITSELANTTFNPALGETELKELLEIRTNRLVKNSKRHDGKTIYYKDSEKTKPYLNTLGDPLSAKEVVKEVFGSLIHDKKPGGGADGDTTETTVELKGEVLTTTETFKTRTEFMEWFKKAIAHKGLAAHEPEYVKIQRATAIEYKIKDLPLE